MGRTTDFGFNGSDEQLMGLLRFLSGTYRLNGWLHNWSLNRLGDWKYGGNSVRANDPGFFSRNMHIWERDGEVIGLMVAEYGDVVFLQVHPHHREVEADMVRWTEEVWAQGKEKVSFAVYEVDAWRLSLLEGRGYQRTEPSGTIRKYDSYLSACVPKVPSGFHITTLAELGDEDAYIDAVRLAFKRDMLNRSWFDSKVQAPGYSHEWNLCLASSDGMVVSFADVRIDRDGGYAEIDPIGTVPEHQRKGLAKVLLRDCFRRLQAGGIRDVHIGSAPPPHHSNRLYDSLGPVLRFEECLWEKELRQ